MILTAALWRYWKASRDLRRARSVLDLPFIECAGLERRLAFSISHHEPLYLTDHEYAWFRRVLADTAGQAVAFDPVAFGQLGNYAGIRVVIDPAKAKDRERRTRTMDDHGGYPIGVLDLTKRRREAGDA